ncbi:MAG TPA: radical SAM protein [Acidobacteriota bacterium]|nr:radical SAM protein [Acidobacteriota bacterium]
MGAPVYRIRCASMTGMGELARNLAVAGRVFKKPGLPLNLVVFVTSRCSLLCRHCFYWKELNGKKNELTLEEYRRISSTLPNLLSVSLTGGEPYLRRDLAEIAATFAVNSRVRNIQIPSNGFLPERTVRGAEAVLREVDTAVVATGVSLDGPPEIHNRIRNHPQSFDRALESFAGLRELKPKFPNLSVGVAITVNRENQHVLDGFLDFVEQELKPDAISLTLVRGEPMEPGLRSVDPELYRRVAERVVAYRKLHPRRGATYERMVVSKEEAVYRLVYRTMKANRRLSPCYAGQLSGVISETGDVYPCEILDRKIGNIRDYGGDFASLWRSTAAWEAYAYQRRLQCSCTYECALSVNVLFNRRQLVPLAIRTVLPVSKPRMEKPDELAECGNATDYSVG